MEVADAGRGLRVIPDLNKTRDGREGRTEHASIRKLSWPWQKGQASDRFTIAMEELLKAAPLKQGDLEIQVQAVDQANVFLFNHTTDAKKKLQFDSHPPQLAVLSQQHYIRQGGCEAILYRVSPDAKALGCPGRRQLLYRLSGVRTVRPDNRICVFALSYDQPVDTPMFIWAEDQAGNRAQMNFWKKVFPTAFRKRDMPVTDQFMQAVVPEILAHTDEISEKPTLIESYLEINRKLRKLNNDQISALGQAERSPAVLVEAVCPAHQLSGGSGVCRSAHLLLQRQASR